VRKVNFGPVVSCALAFGALLESSLGGEGAPAPVAPSVTILYSCDMQGRLVPAACEEGQLGGVARMRTVYRRWLDERPDAVIVDVGNSTVAGREGAEVIRRSTLAAMEKLGYEVVNCGDNEVALPARELAALGKGRPFQAISANLATEEKKPVLAPHHVVQRGRLRIAFVGLARGDVPANHVGEGLSLLDPEQALDASLRALEGQADILVMLAYLKPQELHALARRHPRVNIVLGGRAAATSAPFELVGKTVVAYLGDNGCTVGRLEVQFPRDGRPVASGQVVALDDKIPSDEAMGKLAEDFRAALGNAALPGADWDPKMPCTSSHVGSDVCKLCHIRQFFAWKATRHAGAYATLLKSGKQGQPECLVCHATGTGMPGGFDPQKGVAPAGPEKAKTQDPLKGVGCECCHGGSRRHVGMALKDAQAVFKAPQLRLAEAVRNCQRCHSAGRPCLEPGAVDPFNFDDYANKIKHWHRLEKPPADF